MTYRPTSNPIYGLLAEFTSPEAVIAASKAASAAGYDKIQAYSPFPIEGLHEALGKGQTRLPWLVFLGGLAGGAAGFALQYWVCVIEYPLNIGGRPYFSWPAFIPVTFETTVLGAALTAVLGMLGLCGLPMPYHPLFSVPEFGLASRNRFFLCIESRDKLFELERTREFLLGLQPEGVTVVNQ